MRPRPLPTGLFALLLGASLSCARRDGERTQPVDLFRRLESAPAILLSVDDPELASAASEARDRLLELGWRVSLAPEGSGEASERALPRIRVGTFDSPWASAVRECVGWRIEGRELLLAGRSYRANDSLLLATVPDPEHPGLPLTVVLGSKPSVLAFGLERVVPGWRPSALLWSGGDLLLELPLDPRGRPRLDVALDVEPAWRAEGRSYQTFTHEAARLHVRAARGVSPERAQEVVDGLARVHARVAEVAPSAPSGVSEDEPEPEDGESSEGGGAARRVTRVVLEPTLERLSGYPLADALAFGDAWPARVLALAADGLPDESGAAAARLWLVQAWGAPAHTWIGEGAAYERADRYWGRGLETFGAHLLAAGLVPDVASLVAPERAGQLSAHRRAPARALLVRHLFESRGRATLARLWSGVEELAATPELDASFAAFLRRRCGAPRPPETARRSLARLRGAVLTSTLDPRARERAGWGSAASIESLERLAAQGANAVSLQGFYADRSDGGDGRPFARANASGSLEGDAATALAVAHAHGEGLQVLLVFDFLSRPAGTWSGDLKYVGGAAWRDFFERYERCLTHYALLAELLQVDVLSIGSGMAKASATTGAAESAEDGRPEPDARAQKRASWLSLIALARRAYGGALTYSARWPAQVQSIDFWGELDAVGVLMDHEPERGAHADAEGAHDPGSRIWPVERFARAAGRPLLVTEVGFRSTLRSANGTVDSGGDFDPRAQAKLLEALAQDLETLDAKDSAPRGVWLFDWSSDPSVGGSGDRGYTPRGKAAEAILGRLFR